MVGIESASGRGLWLNCGRPWIRALHLGTRRRVLPVGQSRVQAEDAEPPALQRLLLVGLSRAGAEDAEPPALRRLLLVGPSLLLLEDAALPLQPDVAEDGAWQQVDAADVLVGQADRVRAASGESVVIECLKKGLVNVKLTVGNREGLTFDTKLHEQ